MLLLTFFLFYFATTFVMPSWLVWKKTGIYPVVLPADDTVYGFVGGIFRAVFALIFACVCAQAFAREWLDDVFPGFAFLESVVFKWIGWTLLIGSWVLIVAAQRTMSRSWRVGIDTEHRTDMVQNGLFAYSRNPIFLGMLLTMTGLFAVLPNALTLLTLVVSWVVISVQVRLEEAFLAEQHGQAYADYGSKVRRWL